MNQIEYTKKINKNSVVALIPARGGSKGVPKKNVQLVKGYPLIAYSIAAGLLSDEIERVIVSTDSEEIAQIAVKYGAEVPFLRPSELAEDYSADIGFVKHAIHYFYNVEKQIPEYLIHLRPTTPFREINVIDDAVRICKSDKKCSSLRSGHKSSESPFKWFIRNTEGYFESIIKGIDNNTANDARQKFPDVYIPDGYVDVLKSSFVIENNKLYDSKMLAYESPFCQEVDTLEDLKYIQYQIEKTGSEIYDFLKENYESE